MYGVDPVKDVVTGVTSGQPETAHVVGDAVDLYEAGACPDLTGREKEPDHPGAPGPDGRRAGGHWHLWAGAARSSDQGDVTDDHREGCSPRQDPVTPATAGPADSAHLGLANVAGLANAGRANLADLACFARRSRPLIDSVGHLSRPVPSSPPTARRY